jgi:putative peptide zinc metalloprotease protein
MSTPLPRAERADATEAAHESLFHPRWHRVAGLQPQLRQHAELRLQVQRGIAFYVLRDLTNDNALRLNDAAYAFVGRCDGQASVQQIWNAMLAEHPEQAVTQGEIIELLIGLHGRNLMQFDVTPDVENLFHAQDRRRRRRRAGGVNPLAFRLPLGDPSRLLAPLRRFAPLLFSRSAFVLWLACVLAAALAAAMHWDSLVGEAAKVLQSPGYVLLAWLCYPFIKAVHEAAHALALQRYGGEVRQAGVTLIALSPVPFVDASAADGLRRRGPRALVSAAGILAEMALAALAMGLWLLVQPGLVRDLAFIVMLTGALSTVLTNGNPLLRYDGYFVLCDLLDLRNLGTRSGRWWAEALGRRLFGLRVRTPVEPLPGERGWLIAYAPLSWLYRVVLAVVVSLWLGSFTATLGLVALVVLLGANCVVPLWRMPQMFGLEQREQRERRRAWLRAGLVTAALLALVTLVPLPSHSVAQGVVWLPERAQLRAGTDGFIAELQAADGQQVPAGARIALLDDPVLPARRATLAGDVAEANVRLFHAIDRAPQEAPDLRERLAYHQAELARLDERLTERQITAQAPGRLVLPEPDALAGQFRRRGQTIGYLLTAAPTTVRVAVPQQHAELVRRHTQAIAVRLLEDPALVHAGRVVLRVPGTLNQLPSAALGEPAGGRIATDPADPEGLRTRQPVVVMDIELDTQASARFGARALVRFDHGSAPLASQALAGLQQLLLGHFNPR